MSRYIQVFPLQSLRSHYVHYIHNHVIQTYMEVSWNGGTPKSSISRWDFPLQTNHFGDPHLWKPPYIYIYYIYSHDMFNLWIPSHYKYGGLKFVDHPRSSPSCPVMCRVRREDHWCSGSYLASWRTVISGAFWWPTRRSLDMINTVVCNVMVLWYYILYRYNHTVYIYI